jgi:hypothetical protein
MGKKAFLIGRNTHGLQFAEKDAALLQSVLEKYYDFEVLNVNSKSDFSSKFDSFLDELKSTDDLIVYFSGHAYSPKGTLELILGEDVDKMANKILSTEIFEKLKSCYANNKLLILDCCRGNTALNGWQLNASDRYWILSASAGTAKSSELDELGGGFFTYHLCKALTVKQNEASNNGGKITAASIYNWLLKVTNEYNNTNSAEIAKPHLTGTADTSLEFGDLNQICEAHRRNRRIYLSIPATEEGLADREKFIKEATDRTNYTGWPYFITPSSEEARLLFTKNDYEFEKEISLHIQQSMLSIQMITSDRELDNVRSITQFELIERHERFSISFKKMFWLINSDLKKLEENGGLYHTMVVSTIGQNINMVFEKIQDFSISRYTDHPTPMPGEIVLLWGAEDESNINRVEVKRILEEQLLLVVRPWPDQISQEEQIREIEKCKEVFIYYGNANRGWYLLQQEIILFRARGNYRKVLFIDDPEITKKYDSHVSKRKYDKIILAGVKEKFEEDLRATYGQV